jgi:tetratricopeptide (TPR) repeat protein
MIYGDYKTMFAYYLKVLEINPMMKDIWGNTVGVLENNVHDVPYELYLWKEYRKLNPVMFEPWFYAGSLYRQFTQLQDSAILLLNRANTLRPNNTLVLKELGIAYGNIGDFTKAKEYLLQAEQLGANDAEIFHFIGVIYGMEGQDKLALSYFEKALALEPQNAIYIQDIAVARNRLGL